MMNVKAMLKIAGKFAGPVLAGIVTVVGEIEKSKLEETVKTLVERVSKLENK